MRSETSLNPRTGVLPFNMFRTFSPIFNASSAFPRLASSCEINETEKECVLAIDLPVLVDSSGIRIVVKNGMLQVTLPKRTAAK